MLKSILFDFHALFVGRKMIVILILLYQSENFIYFFDPSFHVSLNFWRNFRCEDVSRKKQSEEFYLQSEKVLVHNIFDADVEAVKSFTDLDLHPDVKNVSKSFYFLFLIIFLSFF